MIDKKKRFLSVCDSSGHAKVQVTVLVYGKNSMLYHVPSEEWEGLQAVLKRQAVRREGPCLTTPCLQNESTPVKQLSLLT